MFSTRRFFKIKSLISGVALGCSLTAHAADLETEWRELATASQLEKEQKLQAAMTAYYRIVQTAKVKIHHSRLSQSDMSQYHALEGLGHLGVARALLQQNQLDTGDKEFIYGELLRARRKFSKIIYLQYKDVAIPQKMGARWKLITAAAHNLHTITLLYLGDISEAIVEVEKALLLNDQDPFSAQLQMALQNNLGDDILATTKAVKAEEKPEIKAAVQTVIYLGKLYLTKYPYAVQLQKAMTEPFKK